MLSILLGFEKKTI